MVARSKALELQDLRKEPAGSHPLSTKPFRPEQNPLLAPASLSGASVIVVSFNSVRTIGRCLESVLETMRPTDEVIVVDNGSGDATTRIVLDKKGADRRVQLISNGKNLGFSAACNIGIRASRGETIALLNPDTVVRPGWLPSFERLLALPNVGAVGPVTDKVAGRQLVSFHLGSDDGRNFTTDQLAKRVRELHRGESEETKLLIGFCLAIRRSVLATVGPLDEDLFLGGEDLELSLRLRRSGYRLLIARDVFVRHVVGGSFLSLGKEEVERLLTESTDRLYRKLDRMFAPGPIPSSNELFGCSILPPRKLNAAATQEAHHAQ